MSTNDTLRGLLACPFCKSAADFAKKTRFPSRHRVACSNSGCGAHYGYWHPKEWNNRAALAEPVAVGVVLPDAVKPFADLLGMYAAEEDDNHEIWKDAIQHPTLRITLGHVRALVAVLNGGAVAGQRKLSDAEILALFESWGVLVRDKFAAVGAARELMAISRAPAKAEPGVQS